MSRYGIPYKIISVNGTPFVNKQVATTLDGYGIKYRLSTPYYPQGNGQAEATNKTLIRILSMIVHKYARGWNHHLLDASWAYRTSSWSGTGFLPYTLVYEAEAISPTKMVVSSPKTLLVNECEWDADSCGDVRMKDLEVVDEMRQQAKDNAATYHKQVMKAYNKVVKVKKYNPKILY